MNIELIFNTINQMKEERVIKDFALFGGMAETYYSEPYSTYDLDILFSPIKETKLIILEEIYSWCKEHDFVFQNEQIIIGDFPVQFIPVYDELTKEAFSESDYDENLNIKVITIEHLMAIALKTFRPKDKQRFIKLYNEKQYDNTKLMNIIKRFNLINNFNIIKGLLNE